MWREVLTLALFVALDPAIPAVTLLVISRPRPVQNLFAFWLGSLVMNLLAFVLPLLAMQLIPAFADFARAVATPDPGTSINRLQLGSAVAALLLAALLIVRLLMRNRDRKPTFAGTGEASPVSTETNPSTPVSRPGRIGAVSLRVHSVVMRHVRHVQQAWEGGSLWVSVLMGMGLFALPPLTLLVATVLVASGASIATQIASTIAFVIVMLGVVELALLGYLISPTKTQAVLQPLHDWSAAHRQQILITLLIVIGSWQLVKGFGIA